MPDMLVRMKKGKNVFEVLVEEGKVAKYRNGEIKNLSEVLAADIVWLNASKGKRASAEQLMAAFGTDDTQQVLQLIVSRGDSQESEGERKEKLDSKRQELINYIAKQYVDPKSNKPLPLSRIENALVEIKARVDPVQSAEKQATALAPKLATVMAMKKGGSSMLGTVTVSNKLAGAVSSAIRKHATVLRENFSGSQCKFEVDVHDESSLIEAVSRASKGEFDFALDNPAAGAGGSSSADAAPKGKGKKKSKRK